jgi:site-specific DNA-methyltransferase (adenine-specific)
MDRHWTGIELGDTQPIVRRLSGEQAGVLPKLQGDSGKGMTRTPQPGVMLHEEKLF